MGSQATYKVAMEALRHIQDSTPPWDDILTASRAIVGSDGATLMMFSGKHDLLLMHQKGVDAAAEKEYRDYYHQHDAVAEAALASPPGRWWDTVELQRMDGAARHPFYGDYLPRHRMRQVMAYVILGGPERRAAISFQRQTPKDNAVDGLSRGPVAAYLRALSSAIAEREQRGNLQLETIEQTLQGLGEACFIASPSGRLQRCSAAAYDMLREAKMLASETRALHHERQDVIAGLVAALAASFNESLSKSFAAPTTWGHGIRFDIIPAPLLYRLSSEPALFVRMRKNNAFAVPELEELAAFFALTPAEAKVLAGLIAGHSPSDYARTAGVAEHTVRNQIASLMRKMSCTRQPELVRLGSSLL
jgi:DNA-binding CsgD family transcriptional regulator